MTHTHLLAGTVEDLEAAKGDDEEEEKEEQSANKFMKKSKSAPKGKKSFTARCNTVPCFESDTAREMGWDVMKCAGEEGKRWTRRITVSVVLALAHLV
jgi:hypothetical protein